MEVPARSEIDRSNIRPPRTSSASSTPVMSALPRTQVLNSTTFKAPPLDDKSLSLPDFYDWQSRNSPGHPFFVFEDGPEKPRTISWAEAACGIHRAAHLAASRVSPEDAAAALEGRPVIIAALAATGQYRSPQCRTHASNVDLI